LAIVIDATSKITQFLFMAKEFAAFCLIGLRLLHTRYLSKKGNRFTDDYLVKA